MYIQIKLMERTVRFAASNIRQSNFGTNRQKILLDVNFDEKDVAKESGAKWDADLKKWYMYVDEMSGDTTRFGKWLRTYLNVPKEARQTVKSLGAKFDPRYMAWYVPGTFDSEPFQPWTMPGSNFPRKVVFLRVPPTETKDVKESGAKFNPYFKKWYIYEDQVETASKTAKWNPACFTYINVPFAAKDHVKSQGALWDPEKKSWYVPATIPIKPFEQYLAKVEQRADSKIFLNVPFSVKDRVKDLGAEWDFREKKWSLPLIIHPIQHQAASRAVSFQKEHPKKIMLFLKPLHERFQEDHKSFLDVPSEMKLRAKKLGADWDNQRFVPPGVPLSPFMEWIGADQSHSVQQAALKAELVREGKPLSEVAIAGGDKHPMSPVVALTMLMASIHRVEGDIIISHHAGMSGDSSQDSSPDHSRLRPRRSTSPSTPASSSRPASARDNYVVFFDVETTGLPSRSNWNYFPNYQDSERYDSSRIVQMSLMLCDKDTLTEMKMIDVIIRADGFEIPAESTLIHGIDTQRSHQEGVDFVEAMRTSIAPALRSARYLLAHNASFDVSVLKAELHRFGLTEEIACLEDMEVVCTMKATKSVVKCVNELGRIKSPKLKELYEFATKKRIENEHNSKFDVINLKDAIKALLDSNQLRIF